MLDKGKSDARIARVTGRLFGRLEIWACQTTDTLRPGYGIVLGPESGQSGQYRWIRQP